jgi:hypothetical protein
MRMKTSIAALFLLASCHPPMAPEMLGNNPRFVIQTVRTENPGLFLVRDQRSGNEWIVTYYGGIIQVTP